MTGRAPFRYRGILETNGSGSNFSCVLAAAVWYRTSAILCVGDRASASSERSRLRLAVKQLRSMEVGQASNLSNFIEVVLRFAWLQYVHRLEAYATFHARLTASRRRLCT